MFNFLDFFNNNGIFAVGTSLLNSYAHLRANKERQNQQLYQQKYYLRQQQENIKFDQQQLLEKTAEYGAISSYHVDMLRQEQMSYRQQLGYNILSSGIGITATDSAGLLLKHMAYMDEMKARSVEAEMFYKRPRSSLNPAMMKLNKEAINRNIKNIHASSPWENLGTILKGARDLSSISRIGEDNQ